MYIFQLTLLLSLLLRYIIKRIFFQNISQFIKTAGFLQFQVYWVLWLAMILLYSDRQVCPPGCESQVLAVKFRNGNIYKASWAACSAYMFSGKKKPTNQPTKTYVQEMDTGYTYDWSQMLTENTNCWNRHRNSIPNWD